MEYDGLASWGTGDTVKVAADIWKSGRELEMV